MFFLSNYLKISQLDQVRFCSVYNLLSMLLRLYQTVPLQAHYHKQKWYMTWRRHDTTVCVTHR
jgi:hypothetical protein